MGLPDRGPGSGPADPLPGMIDSSFLRLYTGPPKPPVVGDLAGFRTWVHADRFGATTQGRRNRKQHHRRHDRVGPPSLLKFFSDTSWSSGVAEEYDGRIPVGGHQDSFLCFSVDSRQCARGGQRMDQRSPVVSSSDDSTLLQATLRPTLSILQIRPCGAPAPAAKSGRAVPVVRNRSAPAVPELAAGNRLQ